jgi:hypothetical protein
MGRLSAKEAGRSNRDGCVIYVGYSPFLRGIFRAHLFSGEDFTKEQRKETLRAAMQEITYDIDK